MVDQEKKLGYDFRAHQTEKPELEIDGDSFGIPGILIVQVAAFKSRKGHGRGKIIRIGSRYDTSVRFDNGTFMPHFKVNDSGRAFAIFLAVGRSAYVVDSDSLDKLYEITVDGKDQARFQMRISSAFSTFLPEQVPCGKNSFSNGFTSYFSRQTQLSPNGNHE
ncbi:MAG: hypothetical protein AAB531_02510 [Patescibacteria group bacterium]